MIRLFKPPLLFLLIVFLAGIVFLPLTGCRLLDDDDDEYYPVAPLTTTKLSVAGEVELQNSVESTNLASLKAALVAPADIDLTDFTAHLEAVDGTVVAGPTRLTGKSFSLKDIPATATARLIIQHPESVKRRFRLMHLFDKLDKDENVKVNENSTAIAMIEIKARNEGKVVTAAQLQEKYPDKINALAQQLGSTLASAIPEDKTAETVTEVSNKVDEAVAAIDRTPPVIADITGEATSPRTASITFSTDEPVTATITYKLANGQPAYATPESYTPDSNLRAVVKHHYLARLAGLTPASTYYYNIQAQDALNNSSTSEEKSFTTPSEADTTRPNIIDLTVDNVTHESAVISWTTDKPTHCKILYKENSSTPIPPDESFITVSANQQNGTAQLSYSVKLEGLAELTSYDFYVFAYDEANNEGSAYDRFTTEEIQISINNVQAVAGVDNVTVTWETDIDTTTMFEYGLDENYGLGGITGLGGPASKQHVIQISNLQPDTSYTYHVGAEAGKNTMWDFPRGFKTGTSQGVPGIKMKKVSTGILYDQAKAEWQGIATLSVEFDRPVKGIIFHHVSGGAAAEYTGEDSDQTNLYLRKDAYFEFEETKLISDSWKSSLEVSYKLYPQIDHYQYYKVSALGENGEILMTSDLDHFIFKRRLENPGPAMAVFFHERNPVSLPDKVSRIQSGIDWNRRTMYMDLDSNHDFYTTLTIRNHGTSTLTVSGITFHDSSLYNSDIPSYDKYSADKTSFSLEPDEEIKVSITVTGIPHYDGTKETTYNSAEIWIDHNGTHQQAITNQEEAQPFKHTICAGNRYTL